MRIRADVTRLLLGFRGMALLRAWPMGDPDVAGVHLAAMRELLDAEDGERVVEIDDEGLAAAYEAWATAYDDEPNGLIEAEQHVMEDLIADLPPGRALDAACGTGRLTAVLVGRGNEVVGVDRSDAMLAAARRKGIPARFVLGELDALPVPDRSFDLVVCGLALTHATRLDRPIAEMARVVRNDGSVLLSDLHPLAAATGGQAQPQRADGTRLLARNHVHWTGDYVRAFRAAGLEIERCEEPRVDRAFLDTVADDLRDVFEAAWLGMPVAIVWLLRRP